MEVPFLMEARKGRVSYQMFNVKITHLLYLKNAFRDILPYVAHDQRLLFCDIAFQDVSFNRCFISHIFMGIYGDSIKDIFSSLA